MNKISNLFWGFIGILLLPITFPFSILLVSKLEEHRKQKREDLFEQEAEQFQEMGIELKKTANISKAEMFDVKTSFGKTEAIRWTDKNKTFLEENIWLFVIAGISLVLMIWSNLLSIEIDRSRARKI